jgi:hypothetical protein
MSDGKYLPNGLLRSITPWSADEVPEPTGAGTYVLAESIGIDLGPGVYVLAEAVGIDVDELLAEQEHEAEQERQQQLHDEMINDMLIEDGRWG